MSDMPLKKDDTPINSAAAPDTIAADINTTATLTSSASGTIESSDLSGTSPDVDWFRVTLTAHHQYSLDAWAFGGSSSLMTRQVYAADGTPVSAAQDGLPTLLFTPETSGTYYFAVSAAPAPNPQTGSYTVNLFDNGVPADVPANATTNQTYAFAGSSTYINDGVIQSSDVSGSTPDSDWYKFTLIAGHHYEFTPAAASGTLDVLATRIYTANGTALTAIADDSNTLDFTPTSSGDYYLAVSAGGHNPQDKTGDYKVFATDVGANSFSVTYDQAINTLPAGFTDGIAHALTFLSSEFSDAVHVNVHVGYGEVRGTAVPSGAVGGASFPVDHYSYAQIRSALIADAKSPADQLALSNLPATDPTGHDNYYLSRPEAAALGLYSGTVDVYIGLGNTVTFDYDNSDGVTAGSYDFFAATVRAVSKAMGRVAGLGTAAVDSNNNVIANSYTLFDLFRYANGARDLDPNHATYFSLDGSDTGYAFNTANGAKGDWDSSVGIDPFRALSTTGQVVPMSATDFEVLDVLGWDRANHKPTDIALSNTTVFANSATGTVIGALSASDPDASETFSYSLITNPGHDFAIDGTNLVVAGPLELANGATRDITVQVTDSADNTFNKTFTVTLSNPNSHAPTITTAPTQSVMEKTTLVAALTSTDPDPQGINPAVFSISGGADAVKFDIVGGNLVFRAAPHYATDPHSYHVQVTASDGTNTSSEIISVNLIETKGVAITGTDTDDTIAPGHTVAGQPVPTSHGDVIYGNAGNDTLDGGRGADTMIGGTGNDKYLVDNAGDLVTEAPGEGTDTVYASVDYTLQSGSEVESLRANAGATGLALTGNEIANRIFGGAGNDTLDGKGGADFLIGGAGNDTYIVDNTGVRITEAANGGTDTIDSSISLNLGANVENLVLTGSASINGGGNGLDNHITGNNGDNALNGGAGNDVLIGGGGRDSLTGGGGNDTFVFLAVSDSGPTGATRDVITDFAAGDRIDLSAIDAISATPGVNDAFSFIGSGAFTHHAGELRAYAAGANTIVAGDVDGNGIADFQIQLKGSHTLSGADFLL